MTKVNTDGLLIHPDEALELCIHHLRLAHLFYQNIPEGNRAEEKALLFTELNRQLADKGKLIADLAYPGYSAFILAIVDSYADDKEQNS